MPDLARSILAHLERVAHERRQRAADATLAGQVLALKAFQQQRFAHSHADLLAHRRYAPAARFFLDDLYGPQDFAERDAQFVRIVPALVRLFPQPIVATVNSLAELHGLSEALDSDLAQRLPPGELTAEAYVQGWRDTGRPIDRRRQIDLVIAVGSQLDGYTRNRLLRQSLKLMRAPARAAGLSALQAFLERGFDTFAGISPAAEFLTMIETRERTLAARLFDPAEQRPLAPA